MKRMNRRGQSIGEYAILFAIVLGAVVAMQNFVRNRIAGQIAAEGNIYLSQAGNNVNIYKANQTSESSSSSNIAMTDADNGQVGSASRGTSNTTSD